MDDSLARYRPYLVMTLLFVIVLAGTILLLRRPEPAPLAVVTPTPRATPTVAVVVVDVRGAVAKPGVYTLPYGSRVQEALAVAGNTLANAEIGGLNLARKLMDGEQIYVPTTAEATRAPQPVGAAVATARPRTTTPIGKININTATLEDLDTLPGIGPAIAQRILDYRNQNGPFKRLEDLKKVRGIGDVIFANIRDLITLD